MNALTPFEQAVLRAIQEPLAICEQPFAAMAETLACDQATLLAEIGRLRDDGWIRRYRPRLRYRALGRVAVLAAAAVATDPIEQAAAVVSALAGVSHNYQRDGRLNLWFTVQGASMSEIDATLERLRGGLGVAVYRFAAENVYKLDVRFDPAGPGPMWFTPGRLPERSDGRQSVTDAVALSPQEKQAIEVMQQDVPLAARPFDALLGTVAGNQAVALVQSLVDKGVLGGFAAVLDYRRLGYAANAMVCMAVDEGRMDVLGGELARLPAVSHCYRRQTHPDWPYALYAMFHADTPERIEAFVRDFCQRHAAADYAILPTVREFKKSPVHIAF